MPMLGEFDNVTEFSQFERLFIENRGMAPVLIKASDF